MNQRATGAVVIGAFFFSLLPMWRQTAGGFGLSFWQYMNAVILTRGGDEYYPHQTISEAIESARIAYCEVKGLDYEQSYSSHYTNPVLTRV